MRFPLRRLLRSNDMFAAWPANAMGLRALQQHILAEIQGEHPQLKLGPLMIISQSAHIYSDCWEHADQVIQREYPKLAQHRDYDDPSGSFLISLQNQAIVVEHLTPGSGEVVNCYSGKSARSLYQQIAAACPSLMVEHAFYLGTELQKAEMALRDKKYRYQQDQELKEI